LNLNYVAIVKHDIDKLLLACFIKLVKKTTYLSPIVVVLQKNGKLRICINFRKLNATTKKDPYLLPFTDEVINTVVSHEVYIFLNGI
jgi:hypothetical protein